MDNMKVVFDILIICLLFPAIIYMIVLNQRIKTLRGQKEDFLKLIAVFNDVTAKAEASLLKIKTIGETSGKNLKELVDQASSLREDLAFMNDRAVLNVGNLEKLIREAKFEEENIRNGVKPSLNQPTYGAIDDNFNNQNLKGFGKKTTNSIKSNRYDDADEDVLAAIKMAKTEASKYDKNNAKKEKDNRDFNIDDDEHTEIERELIRDVFMNIHKKGE